MVLQVIGRVHSYLEHIGAINQGTVVLYARARTHTMHTLCSPHPRCAANARVRVHCLCTGCAETQQQQAARPDREGVAERGGGKAQSSRGATAGQAKAAKGKGEAEREGGEEAAAGEGDKPGGDVGDGCVCLR